MNIDLMIKVRDCLVANQFEFKMKNWFTVPCESEVRLISPAEEVSCGTAACIGGTAMALMHPSCTYDLWSTSVFDGNGNNLGYMMVFSADMFDLNEEEANNLFNVRQWPHWVNKTHLRDGERAAAVALLTRLIEDGTTDCLFDEREDES